MKRYPMLKDYCLFHQKEDRQMNKHIFFYENYVKLHKAKYFYSHHSLLFFYSIFSFEKISQQTQLNNQIQQMFETIISKSNQQETV